MSMTENEAIKDIQFLARRYDDLQEVNMSVSQESLDMAIKALEDMQKLKELGECYVIPKKGTFEVNGINVHTAIKELEQYRAIGTVEEFKSMKENGAFTGVELAQLAAMQMRLRDYQSIGTIEEFKALKEKNTPNPHYCKCGGYISKYNGYRCTDCGALHSIID